MKYLVAFACFLSFLSLSSLSAQVIYEELCIDLNNVDSSGYSIFIDDDEYMNGLFPNLPQPSECYGFDQEGIVIFGDPIMCCDTFYFEYNYEGSDIFYFITLILKCDEEKPDCSNVNLSDFNTSSADPGNPTGQKLIVYACEMSTITYSVNPTPGFTYVWDTGGVPFVQTSNTINISWPSSGNYTIVVEEYAPTLPSPTLVNTFTYCIEVLDAPDADFTIAGGCGCLNTPVTFNSTSIGGNHFFWDFGDSNTDYGGTVTHTYTVPGIYNVTLVVVQDNTDAEGNPLCCCADTITYPVTIDPREGPEIFWISTLCEGDSTKYWTDATGCTYSWSAVDDDGNNVLPVGTITTNDTLCVVWPSGPFGTVSLSVTGCTPPQDYCTKPTTAIVPIIQSISNIQGEDTVCTFSTHFYDLPKWPTVTYDWSIVPASAGTVVSGNGTNAVSINWLDGPAMANIVVNYQSAFLGGLPGHSPEDCEGMATLKVTILPEFEIKYPSASKFCINEVIYFGAGPIYPSVINPVNGFIWEVTPSVGPSTTYTGLGLSDFVTSFSNPGMYTISVYPAYPNPYCNDTITKKITIVEVPLVDSITGNMEICPMTTHTYFGHTSTSNTQLEWVVIGGSFSGPSIGNPVTVDWGNTSPFIIGVRQVQQFPPLCASDYIYDTIAIKDLIAPNDIMGPDGCVNEVSSYTIVFPQPAHPETAYSWSVDTPNKGSVISGETSPTCGIQWNDMQGSAIVRCTLSLCEDTIIYTKTFNINKALPVLFYQNQDFCPGSTSVTLQVTQPSTGSYNWSPSAPNASTINVLTAGNYVVTVTDANNCTSVGNYEVFENGTPNANLTSQDILTLCIGSGGSVDLQALAGPFYSIEWFRSCGGPFVSLGMSSPDPTVYTHTNTNTVSTCVYYYEVTNTLTGCMNTSNTLTVVQQICNGDGCDPQQHSTDVTSSFPSSLCNNVTFNTSVSGPVTIIGWNFGDPINFSSTGPLNMPNFTYTEAGYYVAEMLYTVPNTTGTGVCNLFDTTAVCIPLAADFDISYNCGTYTFVDNTSYVPGAAPNTWTWDFGDTPAATGSGSTTSHLYTASGSITVTLTVTNTANCMSQKVKTITVIPPPTANIVVMPPDTCIHKPFSFSNFNNTGIVGWNWDFGDGSTNGGSNPSHAYLSAGSKTVNLTVTDVNGCTGTASTSITVHPAATTGDITYTSLFLCPGDNVMLTAPLGNSYTWSNGANTQSIIVTMGGTYSVTVSDANDCTFEPEAVEVIEYPSIDATILGNPLICGNGCNILYANFGAGYIYEWKDQFGTILSSVPGSPNKVEICFGSGVTDVFLQITDLNGCVANNNISISYDPGFTASIIASTPLLCAGTPITLTAIPTDISQYSYNWNNGANLPSTIVTLEGVYKVTVTDVNTGCYSIASITVHPLPDLCIVPKGCYTACDPDTICAPDGLNNYMWLMNGTPMPAYDGLQCIIVNMSGNYNFIGTNQWGCVDTSDILYLEMIPCCRPGDSEIYADPRENCCYELSYVLNQEIFYGLCIQSPNSDLDLDLGTIDPQLQVSSNLPSLISLENMTSGDPLPSGALNMFSTICIQNPTSNPSIVIFDWKGEDGTVLCSDTLYLECVVEPDCIYVSEDEIYCDADGNIVYTATICNPSTNTYDIAYIDIVDISPVGITLSPSFIDLTSNPLLIGECRMFTFSVSGSSTANQTLCYQLVGHENNPATDPSTLCCSSDSTYCVFIPGCTPCDMVYVSDIDTSTVGECCFDISINNYFEPNLFTGIDICVISNGATIDILNPFTSPWDILNLTSTTASLDYVGVPDDNIPLGDTQLPTICIGESIEAHVLIEIKWMIGTDVFCKDTIDLVCPNDCGYLEDVSVICNDQGGYFFSAYIVNTSNDTMHSAFIDWGIPALDPLDLTVNLGALPPGGIFGPIVANLGQINNLNELCVITTLHTLNHDDHHIDCCEFKTTIPLPQCDTEENCLCGPEFEMQVEMGISCTVGATPFSFNFSPIGNLSDCDKVIWNFVKLQQSMMSIGNESVSFTFPSHGEFTVCMIVIRTQPDGKQCKIKVCKDVNIFHAANVALFPNPVTDDLLLIIQDNEMENEAEIEIFDYKNTICKKTQIMISDKYTSAIDVSDLKSGVYTLRTVIQDVVITKRFIVIN